MLLYVGFTQQTDKLEFARRAGGQVVTNVVCFRSQPDPLGIVLWRYKSEFVGRADSQVVTNVVCFRSLPFNLGMIATGNH